MQQIAEITLDHDAMYISKKSRSTSFLNLKFPFQPLEKDSLKNKW